MEMSLYLEIRNVSNLDVPIHLLKPIVCFLKLCQFLESFFLRLINAKFQNIL